MLNFILGPSGSGKSYQMLAELRARAERGERSILIVPEQFTSSTEGQLYRTLGDSLSAYVESYSFTSLAEALLRRYGGAAVPTLTEAGREYGEEIWSRHQALRSFLVDDLGVDPEVADHEACEMEHTVSRDTMNRWMDWLDRLHGERGGKTADKDGE